MDELPLFTPDATLGVVPFQPVGLNNVFAAPNKLFEYLSARVPVVATDLPELRRMVKGLDIGIVCDTSSPEDLAAAINRLLEDPGRREMMRAREAELSAILTWDVESTVLLDLYSNLLGTPRVARPEVPSLRLALSEPLTRS